MNIITELQTLAQRLATPAVMNDVREIHSALSNLVSVLLTHHQSIGGDPPPHPVHPPAVDPNA